VNRPSPKRSVRIIVLVTPEFEMIDAVSIEKITKNATASKELYRRTKN